MANIQKFYQTIVDEGIFEIIAGGTIEQCPSQIEECHGFHEVGGGCIIELSSVEVVIAGVGINILPRLSKKQINKIVNQINIEEAVNA